MAAATTQQSNFNLVFKMAPFEQNGSPPQAETVLTDSQVANEQAKAMDEKTQEIVTKLQSNVNSQPTAAVKGLTVGELSPSPRRNDTGVSELQQDSSAKMLSPRIGRQGPQIVGFEIQPVTY